MAKQADLDVLVVGGGPVGLFAAHELCRHGVSPDKIRVIDKRRAQKPWCKAVGIQSRTQELIFAASQGLSDAIQSNSLHLKKAALYRYYSDDTDTDNELVLEANFSSLRSQFNRMAVLEQYNTENAIAHELESNYGVRLERGVELVGFNDRGSFVEVKLRNGDTLRVKYLIAADGAHSFVRSQLKLNFEGETYNQKFVLFHGELNDSQNQLPPGTTCVYSGEQGMLFFIPLKDGTMYLIADLDADADDAKEVQKPTTDDIEAIFAERGLGGLSCGTTKWLSSFRVESKQIEQYSEGRVYLAGDACHVHSPVGGQGMNMGLQDTHNLCWKLALVLNQRCAASLLESYNAERHFVDKTVVDFVDVATKGALLRSPFLLKLRTTAQRLLQSFQFLVEAAIQAGGQITYSYRECSALAFEHWSPPPFVPWLLHRRQQNITRLIRRRLRAGDRCPDFVIPGDADDVKERRFYELFRDATRQPFVLVLFAGRPSFRCGYSDYADVREFKREVEASECGAYCKVLVVGSEQLRLHEQMGVYQQCCFLVRPDQYIGLRSQPLSLDALRYYLVKKVHATDVRIGDVAVREGRNMEAIDPAPTILLTALVCVLGYVIGNNVLSEPRKPRNVLAKVLSFWK